jgi:hypothetical protein
MPSLSAAERGSIELLLRDLDRVFGARLESLGAYHANDQNGRVHTLAVVDRLTFEDLAKCVPFADDWLRRGIAAPLILGREELRRTLDVFPLEYAAIAATLTPLRGDNPFATAAPSAEDVRRALETQANSHLIHLREGFLESRGEAYAIGALLASSVAPLRTLLAGIARLVEAGVLDELTDDRLASFAERHIGVPSSVVREVFSTASGHHAMLADPSALLARYIDAAERIWAFVDAWA